MLSRAADGGDDDTGSVAFRTRVATSPAAAAAVTADVFAGCRRAFWNLVRIVRWSIWLRSFAMFGYLSLRMT